MGAQEVLNAQIDLSHDVAAIVIQKRIVALQLSIDAAGFDPVDTADQIVARAEQFLKFIG